MRRVRRRLACGLGRTRAALGLARRGAVVHGGSLVRGRRGSPVGSGLRSRRLGERRSGGRPGGGPIGGRRALGRRRRRLRRRTGRRRRRPRREEEQRVDVALLVGGDADPEIDVWLGKLRDAARTDGPDRRPLCEICAAHDTDRAEVDERDRVSGRCLNRHCLATGWNGSREGHCAGGRCDDRRADRRADVDAAMLAGRVRVAPERERPQDRAVDRPRPSRDGRRSRERDERDDGHGKTEGNAHDHHLVVRVENEERTVPGRSAVVK
jgi:hypothetical protein